MEVEIQQRAVEYAAMREAFSPEAVEDLLREMPPFEDNKASALEQRLREKEGDDSAAVVKASRPSAAQRKRAAQSAAAARAVQEVADQERQEQGPIEDDPVSPISGKCRRLYAMRITCASTHELSSSFRWQPWSSSQS